MTVRQTVNRDEAKTANHLIDTLFKLATRYPELSIIISVMLLLLLPLAVVSQATDGRGFVFFTLFFLFSLVVAVLLYLVKGFVAAVAHSPTLKVVSSWVVGLTVMCITLSLGISVSALMVSHLFTNNGGNKLVTALSGLATSVFVISDDSSRDNIPISDKPKNQPEKKAFISMTSGFAKPDNSRTDNTSLVHTQPEKPVSVVTPPVPAGDAIARITTPDKPKNPPEKKGGYQECLNSAKSEQSIYDCIDKFQP